MATFPTASGGDEKTTYTDNKRPHYFPLAVERNQSRVKKRQALE
jgi:hypothetical protein